MRRLVAAVMTVFGIVLLVFPAALVIFPIWMRLRGVYTVGFELDYGATVMVFGATFVGTAIGTSGVWLYTRRSTSMSR